MFKGKSHTYISTLDILQGGSTICTLCTRQGLKSPSAARAEQDCRHFKAFTANCLSSPKKCSHSVNIYPVTLSVIHCVVTQTIINDLRKLFYTKGMTLGGAP